MKKYIFHIIMDLLFIASGFAAFPLFIFWMVGYFDSSEYILAYCYGILSVSAVVMTVFAIILIICNFQEIDKIKKRKAREYIKKWLDEERGKGGIFDDTPEGRRRLQDQMGRVKKKYSDLAERDLSGRMGYCHKCQHRTEDGCKCEEETRERDCVCAEEFFKAITEGGGDEE